MGAGSVLAVAQAGAVEQHGAHPLAVAGDDRPGHGGDRPGDRPGDLFGDEFAQPRHGLQSRRKVRRRSPLMVTGLAASGMKVWPSKMIGQAVEMVIRPRRRLW